MKYLLPSLLCLLALACTAPRYQTLKVQYASVPIGKYTTGRDSALQDSLQPYTDKMNQTMTAVIGRLDDALEKNTAFNTLGFMMTDAYLQGAARAFGRPADVALMNNGGIRLNQMLPGPITVGKVYELMPFDNLLVLVELSGSELQTLMNALVGRGIPVPVSGATYTLRQKQATQLMVNGQPVDAGKTYTVAMSDYMANGGDDVSVLRGKPQINVGYLQRDALLEYIKNLQAKGLGVKATTENRTPAAND